MAVDEVPKIIIEKNDRGQVAVTMDLFDSTGDIVAEIQKSQFTINPNNHFKVVRKDKSSLVEIPRWKEEVLSIGYLNPSEIKITGVFHYPGINPVRITEDALHVGSNVPRRQCMGGPLRGGFNVGTKPPQSQQRENNQVQ
jgi:hypothetical protein